MDNLNLFKSFQRNTIKDICFRCPSCGARCSIEDKKCHDCSYDLTEYKSILFTGYLYLDSSYQYSSNGRYLEALIDVSKFIALFPNDEEGNKLYIFLLVKNGMVDKAKKELELFEKKFPMNPFIMEIEKGGIENIAQPGCSHKSFSIENPVESLRSLCVEYSNYRIKNTNDIIDLAIHFFDLISILKEKQSNKCDYSQVIDFYEKNFISFLSKKEIRVESFDGKNYSELSDDELKLVDVIGTITDKKLKDGQIKTIYPALFLRAKMIFKQKIQVNKLTK